MKREIVLAYVYVMLCGMVASTLLVPLVRRLALRFHIVDAPGDRKVHLNAVPLLGGVAVFGAFYLVVFGNLFLLRFLIQHPWIHRFFPDVLYRLQTVTLVSGRLRALFLGGMVIMILGLIDDVRGTDFSYRIKFAVQIIVAIILVASGMTISLFGRVPFLGDLIVILWVVGITNAFNLLDNMNGLSSGVAIICLTMLMLVAVREQEFFVALIMGAMVGVLLGFFRFNFLRGKIFLGDAGSLFIGYTLASLSLLIGYLNSGQYTLFPVLMPIMILGLPIFDTFSVIVIRWRRGKPLFIGDTNHLSHRLVALGMSSTQAVAFIFLITFALAANGIFLRYATTTRSIFVVLQGLGIVAIVALLMVVGERRSPSNDESNLSAGQQKAPRELVESAGRRQD
ncbi:MAG: MraY family glycosyltransferase [Acidobacteriia bacterium]|nr:MraY family glycosyltransferase [Terriglobia bacterium]